MRFSQLPRLNVVLHRPVIPWNTGNSGRTCLGFGAALHLIGPLGFDVGDAAAKRAGLDYWPHVDLRLHENWDTFERDVMPEFSNLFFFSKFEKHGDKPLSQTVFFNNASAAKICGKIALVFGSEQQGLDGVSKKALDHFPKVYLPMNSDAIRSYNLSSSVAMGLCEASRQFEQISTALTAGNQ